MQDFRVRVTKDYLVFCAGHFITYSGKCELLHGHNYRVAAELTGRTDENHYVFDFVTLKRTLKRLCDTLDHRMLLPTRNEQLDVASEAGEVTVRYNGKRYVFPAEDVVLLPVTNTTAEMLAAHLCEQLKDAIGREAVERLTSIELEVEESFGQSAIYRETLA